MTENDAASEIARRQRRAKGLLSIGLIVLATISLADNVQAGMNFWTSFLVHLLSVVFYRWVYKNTISWLAMPWPRQCAAALGKRAALVILIVLLSLLGVLIMSTWLGNLNPQERTLFQVGIIPLFVIYDWVFLAIAFDAADCLPKGWEAFWKHSYVSRSGLDTDDRRAVAYGIGGLLIGNGVVIIRAYFTLGVGSLGWVALGALLVDFLIFGVVFWNFRNGVWWGLLSVGVWTLFNNFSIGIELARDLGAFIEWLVSRVLGLVLLG
jgi:hypothetical protein